MSRPEHHHLAHHLQFLLLPRPNPLICLSTNHNTSPSSLILIFQTQETGPGSTSRLRSRHYNEQQRNTVSTDIPSQIPVSSNFWIPASADTIMGISSPQPTILGRHEGDARGLDSAAMHSACKPADARVEGTRRPLEPDSARRRVLTKPRNHRRLQRAFARGFGAYPPFVRLTRVFAGTVTATTGSDGAGEQHERC